MASDLRAISSAPSEVLRANAAAAALVGSVLGDRVLEDVLARGFRSQVTLAAGPEDDRSNQERDSRGQDHRQDDADGDNHRGDDHDDDAG